MANSQLKGKFCNSKYTAASNNPDFCVQNLCVNAFFGTETKGLICLAFGGTIGMSLLILACALRQFGLWWPLFVVVFYLLALLPRLVVRSLSEASRSHRDGSVFFSVGMVLSSFALPIVLARASVIHAGASYLTVAANFVNFFTIAMYFKMTEREGEVYGANF